MKNRIIAVNIMTLVIVTGVHMIFWSSGFLKALNEMPLHYAYMSGWASYELPQYLLLITVMLVPVAWCAVDNYDYFVVSRKGAKTRENYIVEKRKGSIVVRKDNKRKAKPRSEEVLEITMKVVKKCVLAEATTDDFECEELDLDYYVLLKSGTRVDGEQVTLEIRNKDFYEVVEKEQILNVKLTIQLDRKGFEIDRRFEFII